MSELPPSFRSQQWNGLFAPLNLTAYVTWTAVASGPALDWLHHQVEWSLRTRAGFAALLAFPVLYVARCLDPGEPHDIAEHKLRRLLWLEAVVALLACWGLIDRGGVSSNGGSLPVLLIIVAGQLAVVYSARATLLSLLAINLPLGAMLAQRWGWTEMLSGMLAYAGFQAFAALTLSYAKRAELARDQAQRINAELLATRRLLLESARGEERLRLSRELHDVVGHKLTALKLQLRLQARQAGAEAASIAECQRLADEVLNDVRGVVSTLRQHDGIDLQQALAALVPALPHPQVRLALAPAARA
ncbi:MAG: histidine kinase, partial [Nevskia sp.]|nr:histidine kinase [Nevskia sp.]